MISENLEQTKNRALELTRERGHDYCTTEHFLLALADDEDAAEVMCACAVDLDILRADIVEHLRMNSQSYVTGKGGTPQMTADVTRVIDRAKIHMQSGNRTEVTGANILVALFSERKSPAVYFLQTQSMTRLDAINYISHGRIKPGGFVPSRGVMDPFQAAANDLLIASANKFLPRPNFKQELTALIVQHAREKSVAVHLQQASDELLDRSMRKLISRPKFEEDLTRLVEKHEHA